MGYYVGGCKQNEENKNLHQADLGQRAQYLFYKYYNSECEYIINIIFQNVSTISSQNDKKSKEVTHEVAGEFEIGDDNQKGTVQA